MYLAIVELKETAGLVIARIDRPTKRLLLVGTRSAVTSARLVLDTQVMMFCMHNSRVPLQVPL